MANDTDFRDQIRQLGKLVMQFESLPSSSAKTAGKELVQLLMEIHGAGLDRILEIIFESGKIESGSEAGSVIAKLGDDAITGNLLLLYSLHPDDIETRIHKAVADLGPRLRKLGCEPELAEVRDGGVTLRVKPSTHSCGSSTKELRSLVEDCIYEYAPDVTAVEILGLEERAPTGFVSLESLVGATTSSAGATRSARERDGGI